MVFEGFFAWERSIENAWKRVDGILFFFNLLLKAEYLRIIFALFFKVNIANKVKIHEFNIIWIELILPEILSAKSLMLLEI